MNAKSTTSSQDPTTIVLPPTAPLSGEAASSAVATPLEDSASRLLFRLFMIAEDFQAEGAVHEAISMYLELIEKYADSCEAKQAEAKLLEIAESLERNGELRQARWIYQQLL